MFTRDFHGIDKLWITPWHRYLLEADVLKPVMRGKKLDYMTQKMNMSFFFSNCNLQHILGVIAVKSIQESIVKL